MSYYAVSLLCSSSNLIDIGHKNMHESVTFFPGKILYVNNQSGHTVTEDQWPEMSTQSLREMMAVEETTSKQIF